jgi:hypothetical protein
MWAVCEYFDSSEEGSDQVVMASLTSARNIEKILPAMGADQNAGSIEESYSIVDQGQEIPLDPDDVIFYSGVFVRNQPYPQRSLIVETAEQLVCESCGILAPCAEEAQVKPDEFQFMCNYCRLHSEQPRIMQSGSHSVCRDCTKVSCAYNPNRENKLVALSAVAGEKKVCVR